MKTKWKDSKYEANCKACGKSIPLDQPRVRDDETKEVWCIPCVDANKIAFELPREKRDPMQYKRGIEAKEQARANQKLGPCCICGAEAEIAWESAAGDERLFCRECQMFRTRVYRLKKMGVWPFVNEGKITTKKED